VVVLIVDVAGVGEGGGRYSSAALPLNAIISVRMETVNTRHVLFYKHSAKNCGISNTFRLQEIIMGYNKKKDVTWQILVCAG